MLAPASVSALCGARQRCIVWAIVLQYTIRALILEYKDLHNFVCESQWPFHDAVVQEVGCARFICDVFHLVLVPTRIRDEHHNDAIKLIRFLFRDVSKDSFQERQPYDESRMPCRGSSRASLSNCSSGTHSCTRQFTSSCRRPAQKTRTLFRSNAASSFC